MAFSPADSTPNPTCLHPLLHHQELISHLKLTPASLPMALSLAAQVTLGQANQVFGKRQGSLSLAHSLV